MIKMFMSIFTGMISLFMAERYHGDQMTEYMVQGQNQYFVKRCSLVSLPSSACPYTPPCMVP